MKFTLLASIALASLCCACSVTVPASYVNSSADLSDNDSDELNYNDLGSILVDPGDPWHPALYCGMESASFHSLVSTVENTIGVESSKAEPALIALDSNALTTAQLKALLSLFDFDDAKVDIANKACRNICDPQNLFTIYESFTFDSSKDKIKSACR